MHVHSTLIKNRIVTKILQPQKHAHANIHITFCALEVQTFTITYPGMDCSWLLSSAMSITPNSFGGSKLFPNSTIDFPVRQGL
jgi:hypothetical protein